MCLLRKDWPLSVMQRHQSLIRPTQAHYQFLPYYLATAVVDDKQNEGMECLYDEGDRNLTPSTGMTLPTIYRLSWCLCVS